MSVELPAILGVVRNPDALIKRFEGVAERFKGAATGDVDGDGFDDALIVDPGTEDGEGPRLDAWRGDRALPESESGDEILGDILFRDENTVWSIDRLLSWIGSLAEQRAARLTGGRERDATLPIRGDGFTDRRLHTADLTGDGKAEVLLVHTRTRDGRTVIDVVGWR